MDLSLIKAGTKYIDLQVLYGLLQFLGVVWGSSGSHPGVIRESNASWESNAPWESNCFWEFHFQDQFHSQGQFHSRSVPGPGASGPGNCSKPFFISVAANHVNGTCFLNGLVMGLADCVN